MATTINERKQGDITVLEILGDLDQVYEEHMGRRSDDLLARGCVRIAVDVGRMTFIDSAGVGGLVSLYKRVRAAGGDIKLSGLAGQPRELFKLLRLDRSFEMYDSINAAVKAFETR